MNDNRNKKRSAKRQFEEKQFTGKGPAAYRRGPFNLLLIGIVILTIMVLLQQWQHIEKLRYDEFLTQLQAGHVEKVTLGNTEISGEFKQSWVESEGKKGVKSFVVDYKPDIVRDQLVNQLQESGVQWEFSEEHKSIRDE